MGDVIVLTHHAPSYQSIISKYKSSPLNGGFASDLEYLMFRFSSIKLWAHGHTHGENDYMIEDCRIVSHPKGYWGELEEGLNYMPLTIQV